MIPISRPDRQREERRSTMDQVDVAKVAEYAGEDADATWRIEADPDAQDRVKEEGLWDLYAELERPLVIPMLARDGDGLGVKVDLPSS